VGTIAGQLPFLMIAQGRRGRVERMMGPGDVYRLKAADMLARAEQYEPIGEEFKALAMAFLRLAEEADRNAQRVLPLDPKRSCRPLSNAGATATAAATDSGTKAPSAGRALTLLWNVSHRIMRRKKIEDDFRKCLDRAANARSRAEEASDPARKAEYLRLERNWLRLARSYEFAQRLKSSWLRPYSANIIVWHHRILEAYYSREFNEERSDHRTVSLARHGAYEVRLVELSRKMRTGAEQLWLELFDHDHEHTIDSYSGRTLVDITAAAESLCSNAKYLSQTG
jgi:hypothetical protein